MKTNISTTDLVPTSDRCFIFESKFRKIIILVKNKERRRVLSNKYANINNVKGIKNIMIQYGKFKFIYRCRSLKFVIKTVYNLYKDCSRSLNSDNISLVISEQKDVKVIKMVNETINHFEVCEYTREMFIDEFFNDINILLERKAERKVEREITRRMKKTVKNKISIINTYPKMTSYETIINKYVLENNLPYIFAGTGQHRIGNRKPDFVDVKNKKIIEVYARFFKIYYWKMTPAQYENERSEFFKKCGYDTLFIDEISLADNTYKDKILNFSNHTPSILTQRIEEIEQARR